MLIECMIKRTGPTPIELGKVRYMFMPIPIPGRRSDEPSTSVCEINAEEHLEFLLKSRQFRPYKDGQVGVVEHVTDLSGYSIVKHQDGRTEGYRIENNTSKPKLYVGSDGVWRKSVQNLVPFATEFMAWQWLREQTEINETQLQEVSSAEE